ncbi:MAG: copper chaperone PCu(A)C [Hyphomonadaceae bacterium]
MRSFIALWLAIALSACGAPAPSEHDADRIAGALIVEDAWAAPTPSGVDVSAGYLIIHNATAAADRLLSVTSPRAERVEIHEMTMDGAVMRMRPVESLEIASGTEVALSPGGMHLMFYGVAQPFAAGEDIPVQLTFETAGAVNIVIPVRRSAPPTSH